MGGAGGEGDDDDEVKLPNLPLSCPTFPCNPVNDIDITSSLVWVHIIAEYYLFRSLLSGTEVSFRLRGY